jgi:hypothetical protein
VTTYVVPDDPADACAAALQLIVRLPEITLGERHHEWKILRQLLQEITAMLDAENAFAGMSWHDAKHAATVILVDTINEDDAADSLRRRADRVLDGTDSMTWDDSAKMVRALSIAAAVLAL